LLRLINTFLISHAPYCIFVLQPTFMKAFKDACAEALFQSDSAEGSAESGEDTSASQRREAGANAGVSTKKDDDDDDLEPPKAQSKAAGDPGDNAAGEDSSEGGLKKRSKVGTKDATSGVADDSTTGDDGKKKDQQKAANLSQKSDANGDAIDESDEAFHYETTREKLSRMVGFQFK
jgi:hypothetical protein